MKIVSISLASIFTEGMTYQDNLLSDQLRNDGNEVTIIADCYKYENGVIVKTKEEDKILSNGIRLIRKKYINIFGEFVSGKIRAVKGLYSILEDLQPDLIFHHGLQTYELLTLIRYKKSHPEIKLFVDSHEDYYNSATNLLSKYILHKIFYKIIIQKALPYINKVFCVAFESFDFIKDMYNVPDNMMEFYPLGGIIINENSRRIRRIKIRNELSINNDNILLVHSGKMNKQKCTEEVLEAFIKVPDDRLRLILIGSLSEDIRENAEKLISSDNRIKLIGWKTGEELIDYLCSCDLYIQPGTQSATMQNALCCGSPVAVYPYPSHKYLLGNNAFYIQNSNDMSKLFNDILENAEILNTMRTNSYKMALYKLNYEVLARKLYG